MSKRFSETDKWADEWFSSLKPLEKLVFLYMVDKCDNAGFFEINPRLNAFTIGINQDEYLASLKGIEKGYLWSIDGKKVWIKKFLIHQKNWPLNQTNNAHKQILSLMEIHQKNFKEHIINFSPLQAPNQGLISPIGKGIGKGNIEEGENFKNEIFEKMRCQLDRSKFSDFHLNNVANEIAGKYKGQNINNMAALISKWTANLSPDIQPKGMVV